MAPAMATARLRKELLKLQKEPPPDIIAEPDESNILRWFYGVRGPASTPFEGGTYLGKLQFPPEYPMKPPSIYMMTPSGRFQINTKLCMSMSDFHPESWNPMWSVSSIIQGVQSFMANDELTTGGLRSPEYERKKLASLSMAYNQKMFPNLFEGDIKAAFAAADHAVIESETVKQAASGSTTRRRRIRTTRRSATSQESSAEAATNEEGSNKKQENEEQPKQELTPGEIEKRRKRNAKKRVKQKAKKAAEQQTKEMEKKLLETTI